MPHRAPDDPVRVRRVGRLDALEVLHELREVLEVPPEAIDLLDRAVHRRALLDQDAAMDVPGPLDRRPATSAVLMPELIVELAMAGRAAVQQAAAEGRQGEAAERPLLQSMGHQRRAGRPQIHRSASPTLLAPWPLDRSAARALRTVGCPLFDKTSIEMSS